MLTDALKNDIHAMFELNNELLQRCVGDLDADEQVDFQVVSLLADCKQALYAASVIAGKINIG